MYCGQLVIATEIVVADGGADVVERNTTFCFQCLCTHTGVATPVPAMEFSAMKRMVPNSRKSFFKYGRLVVETPSSA